jgi:hypothetical protein
MTTIGEDLIRDLNVARIQRDNAESELFALGVQVEALKKRLQSEGLFDAARKRPIPVAPEGIALVTSKSGAVLHDVLRVLRHAAPQSRLVLVHAAVQGVTAPAEIVDGIQRANSLAREERRAGRSDAPAVILLARGGGSSDDLAAFSSEAVLRAIAASELPVLSAVGHESDITLADLVAVHRLNHGGLEHDGRADDAQQNAQQQGEVARAHAGAGSYAVGGGAPGKTTADDEEHEAGKEIFLTLDFHECLPKGTRRAIVECQAAFLDVDSTYR